MKIIDNKKAYYNYKISDIYEAGLVLSGPEVKSIKKGSIDLKGAYISVDENMEAYLINTYIAPYKPAKIYQIKYNPYQPRKLLLNKKQSRFLFGKQKEKGVSILPLKIYIKDRLIKLEIGIGTGKKKYDKREHIKKRDFERRKRKSLTF
ncbi:SsrA-binding protein SmpB [Patescibacteria group bacterium]|nr:SsrA-binding protein SmpB [Patescibacteria group bacterium]